MLILLDSDSEIVLSDIKGLLFSTEEYQKTINTIYNHFDTILHYRQLYEYSWGSLSVCPDLIATILK